MKRSAEQEDIIESIKDCNIKVSAVPGSGKTTTVIMMAEHYRDLSILLVTYSKNLKADTRQRCADMCITNLEAHSYHSFCNKYYFPALTDSGIKNAINKGHHVYKGKKYDIMVLDETQDMTRLFFRFCNQIRLNVEYKRLCVVGDEYQSIFGFNGSDPRYISLADRIFPGDWESKKLSVSYRLTPENAKLVNYMIGTKRIHAFKPEPTPENLIYGRKRKKLLPRYIVCDIYKKPEQILREYLRKYKPGEIFILAPSIKKGISKYTPLNNMVGKIDDIMYYIPSGDYDTNTEKITRNKVIVSSFHQSKGLERDLVIIVGFDASYYKYYARTDDPTICNNALYVALTRAKKELVLLQSHKNEPFSFAVPEELVDICRYEIAEEPDIAESNESQNHIKSVTEFVKYMTDEVRSKCMSLCRYRTTREARTYLNIPGEVWQPKNTKYGYEEHYESTSELNGIIIPSVYEYLTTGKMSIYECLGKYWSARIDEKTGEPYTYKVQLPVREITKETIKTYIKIAVDYVNIRDGYAHKNRQITKRDWISELNMNRCMERMKLLGIPEDAQYEVPVKRGKVPSLRGAVDCTDENKIYEFKCVSELQETHILQLVLYMYCMGKETGGVLYNSQW
jgi:hypothetical protein